MECLLSTFINRLKDITCATDPNEHDMHRLKLTVAKAMLYNASPDIITEASLLHKRLDAELGTYCHICAHFIYFASLHFCLLHYLQCLFIYLFICIFFSFYSFSLLKCLSIIHSVLFIDLFISLFIFSFHYFFIFLSLFYSYYFILFIKFRNDSSDGISTHGSSAYGKPP